MEHTQTIAHLEIALMELAYAKADARRSQFSVETGPNHEPLEKLISKLDAVGHAVNLAILILEKPAARAVSLQAA